MNNKNLYLLSALEYYTHSNGFTYCSYSDLSKICGYKDTFFGKKAIKELVKLGYIENLSKNGYVNRYKILISDIKLIPYSIMFDDYPIYIKCFLYALKYKCECDYNLLDTKMISRILDMGVKDVYPRVHKSGCIDKIKEILSNMKPIHASDEQIEYARCFRNEYDLAYYQIEKECRRCNSLFIFFSDTQFLCKDCLQEVKSGDFEVDRIISNLVRYSRNSAKRRNIYYDLDFDIILNLYNSQQGKCYYTGLDLKDYSIGEKDCPSIDRIDSTKGYTKDNIVICKGWATIMKMETDLDTFKERISIIYNHLI